MKINAMSSEIRKLLDKMYNLRGEDSVILAKITKEREEALATQERTKKEKETLLKEIENLTQEEAVLAEQGNKLKNVLGNIKKEDFSIVLESLDIDFDPLSLFDKVNTSLGPTIDKVVDAKQKALDKLSQVEDEMKTAIAKAEELELRKDQAVNDQAKLNEYFELALNGNNINITRDEITNLLTNFNFSDIELREAAKIMMFPEDALYSYDAGIKSGVKVNNEINEIIEEKPQPEIKETLAFSDIVDEVLDNNKNVIEEVENNEISEKEKLINLLDDLHIDSKKYSETTLKKIVEKYDENIIKGNVKLLKSMMINLDILEKNYELLYDKELKEKLEKLISIGKEPSDIQLTPGVLVKYDLNGLNNTINVLQISGLDPKKVPLMAY